MSNLTLHIFRSESRIPSGSYGRYLRTSRSENGTWFVDASTWPRKGMCDVPLEVTVAPGSLVATMADAGITEMPSDWALRFGLTDPAGYPAWLPQPHEAAPEGAWRAVIEKARGLQAAGRRALAANAQEAYQAFVDAGADKAARLKALAVLGGVST